MILRIAKFSGVDVNNPLQLAVKSEENSNVIIVDDSKIILFDGLSVL